MQKTRTPIRAGQRVIVRDEPWLVVGAELLDDVRVVRLRGLGEHNRDEVRAVLAPFDPIDVTDAGTSLRARSRRSVLATAAVTIADARRWTEVWTAASARIDLHSWQLEPALAAVKGATRILLADAVGLGKTIQAGLIISELRARGLAERVLVLTPASIREQWAAELGERFGLHATVLDHSTLAATAAHLPPDVNPWSVSRLTVASIDLVKRPEVRASLDALPLDVVVVDEAHHLTPGSDRGALVADLAARAPWVVLATATPHSGDQRAYRFLTALGGSDDSLTVFRRTRAVAETRLPRRTRLFSVTPTAAERALLQGTLEYARAVKRQSGGATATLVASVIARRAASSAAAAHRTLARRLALLTRVAQPAEQTVLPWEASEADGEPGDAALVCAGLADERQEVQWLERLTELAQSAASSSSKIDALRRLVARSREHVLVFSEYRDVVEQTALQLRDVTTPAVLHGGLSPRERRGAVRAFTEGRVRTLVATDAAGEGLNLQTRCRFVVTLELPWTPLRLEQRIGRVDRLGQTRRVHAIHLVHRASFEATVIARLEQRRARTLLPGGDTSAISSNTAVVEQRRLRHLAGRSSRSPSIRASFAVDWPAGRTASGIVLVYSVVLLDGHGGVVQREVIALRAIAGAAIGRRLTRQMIRRLTGAWPLRDELRAEVRRRVDDARTSMRDIRSPLESRLRHALTAVDSRLVLWQGSLFDRHAEQSAQARAEQVCRLRSHLLQRQARAAAISTITATRPQLIAAWVE